MAYRSDLEAAHERIRRLEKEVKVLRAKLEAIAEDKGIQVVDGVHCTHCGKLTIMGYHAVNPLVLDPERSLI